MWFNGCHKDIGGGVKKKAKDQLSGIPLKWMLSRMQPYEIFRDTIAAIKINTYGKVKNMGNLPTNWMLSPGDSLRGIDKYWAGMNPDWNKHRIKIHESVIARLDSGVVQRFKLRKVFGRRTDWYDWSPFKDCFKREGKGKKKKIVFQKDSCICIEVVDDSISITSNVVK